MEAKSWTFTIFCQEKVTGSASSQGEGNIQGMNSINEDFWGLS